VDGRLLVLESAFFGLAWRLGGKNMATMRVPHLPNAEAWAVRMIGRWLLDSRFWDSAPRSRAEADRRCQRLAELRVLANFLMMRRLLKAVDFEVEELRAWSP
jgi:hypothetical protein